ncbi:hypothetical protein Tco_0298494 [Tanacetum coccineum]
MVRSNSVITATKLFDFVISKKLALSSALKLYLMRGSSGNASTLNNLEHGYAIAPGINLGALTEALVVEGGVGGVGGVRQWVVQGEPPAVDQKASEPPAVDNGPPAVVTPSGY